MLDRKPTPLMEILQVNKFYFLNGGSEQYMFSLSNLLGQHGHEIIPFSMRDARNFKSDFEPYFIRQIDYNRPHERLTRRGYVALKTLYSFEARRKLNRLLQNYPVDLAHFHNFNYHLTPSILAPLNERAIPVVQTLHDYHIICPSHHLYDFARGEVCEDCRGKYFRSAIGRKCIKGSALKSLIGSLEGYLAAYLNIYSSRILRFIAPSRFLRDKVIEHGVAADKVVHIANFVDPQQFVPNFNGTDEFVYFGRLEAFKGVWTLIRAFANIRGAKLKIVGDGNLQAQLQQAVAAENLQNIHFLGFKRKGELKKIVSNSLCAVCPSEWYENNPISVLESFALGKPVIGAAIGGIPELVKDGITGLLFSSGDAHELAQKVEYCLHNKDHVRHMGREARKRVEEIYSPKVHYGRILALYSEMIQCV